jgi:hypothetical protein
VIRDLERKLATAAPAPVAIVVGAEPTLEDEDVDFDPQKFATKFKAWNARKQQADAQQAERERAEQADQQKWQGRIDAVGAAASKLKLAGQEEALEVFESAFSPMQRAIIIGGPDDPKQSALLRHALAMSPKKSAELAAIQDPVKFAFAVSKLESKMTVTTKKKPPAPEKKLASGKPGGSLDTQLERLRAKAAQTGNYTEVNAFKAQMKKAKKA